MSSPIEELVDSLKARVAIGPEAGPLLQGLIRLLFSEPGGLKGFIDKLNASGLGAQVSSWIGKADSPPLSTQGVVQAFGNEAIGTLARKVGIDPAVAAAAIGYATPKIIGYLTSGGAIPTSIPAAVAAFLGSGPTEAAASPARPAPQPAPTPAAIPGRIDEPGGLRRWLLPLIVALVVLAFLAHFWEKHEEPAPTPPPAADH